MKMLPSSATMKPPTRGRSPLSYTAAEVPTSTGAIAAGRVRTRAAITQIRSGLMSPAPASRALRGLAEVRLAALLVGVAPLLALLGHVEEKRRVVGELLEAGDAVLVGVEAGLEQAQGHGGEGQHLATPGDGLALQVGERDDCVHQTHLPGFLGLVEAREKPEFLGLLHPDVADQQACPEAAVKAADPRPGLPEAGVVGGDRHVADEVEDVAAAHRIAGDHRDHRLRQAPDLHVQVPDVEAPNSALCDVVVADVAVVAADPLIPARTEGVLAGAGEDDRADLEVVSGPVERVAELREGLGPEGIPHLRPVDCDLRDPSGLLVEDVGEVPGACPLDGLVERFLRGRVTMADRHGAEDSRAGLLPDL